MDFQALVDGMNKRWQEERSETQMTLGQLIARLEELLASDPMIALGGLHSYRGYYSDLALQPATPQAASALLVACRNAMGRVFEGYKGGDYQMGERTPMWVAHYGDTGMKLMAINDDGTPVIAPDED